MEKINYPYEPGKIGIPFNEILNASRSGVENGVIISGSGRQINFEINKTAFKLFDTEFVDRMMYAHNDNGILTFTLQTKNSKLDEDDKFPWEKYPDMFAKNFVGIVLHYFRNMNIKIFTCKGVWYPNSDNYAAFMKNLNNGLSMENAARNTWSGRTFSEYGYSTIRREDVIYGSYEDKNCVTADFHRNITI
jgi:hypothetical protein